MSFDPKRFLPETTGESDTSKVQAALDVLDRFTEAFNREDLVAMDQALHFPHVILSGSSAFIWPSAGQLPASFFADLKRDTGWHHSNYLRREAVLVSEDKVHFLVTYTREKSDGSVITSHDNVWIVTKENGRWAIKLRSY